MMKPLVHRLTLGAFLLAIAGAACTEGPSGPGEPPTPTEPAVATVEVTPPEAELAVGETSQLTAAPKAANGTAITGPAVTWASSDAAVATVSATGQVRGVSAGAATITATSQGKSGTAALTVIHPVASVEVSPAQAEVLAGQATQLTAVVKDADGAQITGAALTWTSSNEAVATVDTAGQVRGVGAGAATITATSQGKSGTAALTVVQPVASVEVSPARAEVLAGQATQLTAVAKDGGGAQITGAALTWTSSNENVATVDTAGWVRGVRAGTATITATSQGVSGSAAVTVVQLVAASVAAGHYHSCALTSAGTAYCWGTNGQGELGDGTNTIRTAPVPVRTDGVLAGKRLTAISTSWRHTVVLDSEGKAYAWGNNHVGQLGNLSTSDSNVPVAVSTDGVLAGKRLTAIAAGAEHTLVLDSDGRMYTWGRNGWGQLGNGTRNASISPAPVNPGALGSNRVTAIAAGQFHSVALDSEGRVYAWGNNQRNVLGSGHETSSVLLPVPVRTDGVLAGKRLVAVASMGEHTVVLDSEGRAYAWGNNANGQLGDGTTINPEAPVAVLMNGALAGKRLTAVATGWLHTVVLDSDGRAYAWGSNQHGQVGDGTSGSGVRRLEPVAVQTSGALAGRRLVAIAAGNAHTVALDSDGNAFAWGSGLNAQLGNGRTSTRGSSNVPEAVIGGITF